MAEFCIYLRYGRPKNPKPLCLFLALLSIVALTSLIPGLSAMPALFLLGTLSPAILYLILLVLPKTGFIQTLRIFSVLFTGIVPVFGICIPAYFDAAVAAGGYPLAGENGLFFGMMFCLSFLTPSYGFVFLLGGLDTLRSVQASQSSPQTDP